MDQVTKVRRYLKREEWKTLITECKTSGMPVSTWCKENGICEQTYYKNLKKLRSEMIDSLPAPIKDIKEKPVAFKKLEVQTPVAGTQASVIIRLNGASVEIADGASQQIIQTVLLALQNIC